MKEGRGCCRGVSRRHRLRQFIVLFIAGVYLKYIQVARILAFIVQWGYCVVIVLGLGLRIEIGIYPERGRDLFHFALGITDLCVCRGAMRFSVTERVPRRA